MRFKLFPAWLVLMFCVSNGLANTGAGWTVAVVDSGFNKNYNKGRYIRSACISQKTILKPKPLTIGGTTEIDFDYWEISKCENDGDVDSSSNGSRSRTLPRVKKLRHFEVEQSGSNFIRQQFFSIYSNHGTNVVNQVLKSAPRSNLYPITVGSFDGDVKHENFKIDAGDCKKHTTTERGFDTYHRWFRCIEDIRPIQITTAASDIARRSSKVVAANFSLGRNSSTLCSNQSGKKDFQQLLNKGVIPVAASGNNFNLPIHWPACLSNVIAVAQTKNGIPTGSSLKGGTIDYFAEVSGNKVTENETLGGTSFAAPLVSGAFVAMKSANPNATINQLKKVLHDTGFTVPGYSARRINLAAAIKGIKELGGSSEPTTPSPTPPTTGGGTGGGSSGSGAIPRPPTPVGQTAVLGFVDDAVKSGAAVYNVFLNGSASLSVNQRSLNPLNANINISDVRDIRLDFEGKYTTRANPRDVRGMEIVINDVSRIVFNTVQPYGDGNSAVYRPHSFILNRNWFQGGNNKIVIREKAARRDAPIWSERTRKVRMEYNSPLKMKFGQTLTSLYGHRVGSKRHLTGLRVTFNGSQSDVDFSVTGFDIDTDTEVAVFLNHRRVGFLNRGSNARNSLGNKFKFRKADLVSSGVNTIEFVNTSTSDREVWGVTNLKLDGAPPDISGIIMMLLSDD